MPRIVRFFLYFAVFCLILLLLAGCTWFYARHVEPYALKKKEIRIQSAQLPSGLQEKTICLFSDTHFNDWYSIEQFSKAVDLINAESPDFVFFLGDLLDHPAAWDGDPEALTRALSEIDASIGKYAVYGNHDHGGGAHHDYGRIMEDAGFTVLINATVSLAEYGLTLCGIDDALIGRGDPALAEDLPADTFNILICHEPDIAGQIEKSPVDLMFSGHTHGGQVRIPLLTKDVLPPLGRNYIRGLYPLPGENGRAGKLYVNPGIGMTKLPFRFLSRPELTVIRLKSLQ